MRAILSVLIVAVGSVTATGFLTSGFPELQAGQPSGAAAGSGTARFVGTWKLISTEQRDAKGQVIAPATPPPPGRLGFITYDPAGYMGVVIMQGGRQKYRR